MRRPRPVAILFPALTLLLGAVFALAPESPVRAATPPGGGGSDCFGELSADGVPRRPGPLLRYGITPRVQAGQVGGAPAPAVPEQPSETHRALARLRPKEGPFVIRLNRLFFSEGERAIREFERLTERYTSRGYLVEYQVRYHPRPDQEGDIGAWVRFVREVVRRLGDNPRVTAFQITNEVNLEFSPDSSDGAYKGARDALVQGVIAAKDEARRRGYEQAEIGFNWFYRTDPDNEREFWEHLRDRGGRPFVEALDWIGLDAYPGTFFPPVEPTLDDYRDGMVNAMSTLRCLARIPRIPGSVPMHIEENGWPTGPGRPPRRQDDVARAMIRAVHDFRGTYGVTDYRWFNLRDANSSDPRFSQQYGLMRDDYSEKPAFGVYCRLVAALSRGNPDEGPRAAPMRCASGGGGSTGSEGRSIDGTSGNDVLTGTPGDDRIRCGSGNDRVDAGAGDDVVLCGSGNDVVSGGAGDDRLLGESGNDRLSGGSGSDDLEGQSGNDRLDLRDGSGNDSADGGSGSDLCSSDPGEDCD